MTETTDIPPINVKVDTVSPSKPDKTPPLFSFQISNPITYIKSWWKKIVGNEGIKLTLQIKPLTALFLMIAFSGIGFGFGRLTVPEAIIRYLPIAPSPTPQPTPDPWKDTAFTGKVQASSGKYFLVTTSAEAITLEIPDAINLKPLIGKRLLVVGRYNKTAKYLVVSDVTDMEILPASPVPLPTLNPSPSPTPTIN